MKRGQLIDFSGQSTQRNLQQNRKQHDTAIQQWTAESAFQQYRKNTIFHASLLQKNLLSHRVSTQWKRRSF
jgi:hypothetical protein